jgi:hypothetical protein
MRTCYEQDELVCQPRAASFSFGLARQLFAGPASLRAFTFAALKQASATGEVSKGSATRLVASLPSSRLGDPASSAAEERFANPKNLGPDQCAPVISQAI